MNNFHFNPQSNKSIQLKKQLEQMNREIQESKKQLQKKNLQLQFYQDPDYVNNKPSMSNKHIKHQQIHGSNNNDNNYQNYMSENQKNSSNNINKYDNLADQIMNGLLQDNSNKQKLAPSSLKSNQYQNQYQDNLSNNMYQNQNNFSPFAQKKAQQQPINQLYQFNQFNQPIPQNNPVQQPSFAPRQNNFLSQNKRQLQKQKLQNPSSFDDNPFLSKAQPVKRSIDSRQQKPIVNQRELQKLKLQQQSGLYENPFWGQSNRNRSLQKVNSNKNPVSYQQYQNVRQKEKQKLQQQLHQNKDFGLYERSNSPTQIPAQKDVQSQNIHKKAAFQNRYSNPFAKNQEQLRQLREEKQREYRRELEEQKKIEEERKKNEKQKVKEQKYAFNAYEPGTGAITGSAKGVQQSDLPIKSSNLSITKKVDPNGRPPVYNYDQQVSKPFMSASDREFMKMKANQLKDSFKKGRILHDEYLSQVKKLAEYYKVDFRELVDRKDLDEKDEDLPWIKEKKQQEPIKMQSQISPPQEVTERRDYQIMENEQSLQKFPDSEASLKNNQYSQQRSPSRNSPYNLYSDQLTQPPFYGQPYPVNSIPGIYTQNLPTNPPQYGLASTSFLQQMQGVDYELMRKMFEQMKAMRNDYTRSLQKQKAFLQQTFMKFLANGMMQNQAQNQNQSQPRNQKAPDLSPRQSNKQQNILPLNLQQNFSDQSMEFIQKSLSGMVNKIPFYSNSINRSNSNNGDQSSFMVGTPQANLSKKQTDRKDVDKRNQETIEQFYSKPYKCKKFKKFSIMVDVSQSSMQIPNVSNFLALKNGKEVLNKLFEEDLLMMKKLQREKDVDKLRNRVDNQLSYRNKPFQQQQSSFQQQTYINQEVNCGQSSNYGETFNTNNNTGKFVVKAEEKKVVVSQNTSNFEEYENYSRSKQREVLSARQKNHRSYKKVDQSVSIDSITKKNNEGQQQKLPDFADQSDIKARSPVYYSPRVGSQILQQDEYQTAQKSTNQQLLESQFYGSSVVKKVISPEAKQSTNKKYKMKKKDFAYEQERQSQKKSKSKDKSLSFKQALKQNSLEKEKKSNQGMMKLITKNNQVLKKYQISPQNRGDFTPRDESVDIREYSSINSNVPRQEDLKNYFSVGSVKDNNGSENASYKIPPLVANLNNYSGNGSLGGMEKKLSDKFNTQKEGFGAYDRQESIEEIKSDNDGLEEDRSEYISSQQYPRSRNQNLGAYQASQQQTVKSINYSVNSSRRPPQSFHISQTVESMEESASRLIRPPLNKKKSTSKKKQSSIVRTKFEKDSILQKPPSSESQINSMIQSDNNDHDLVIDKQPLKFDSNVYDSEYEQSVSQNILQNRISQLQNEQKMKISQPQINISPPVIVNTKSSVLNIQGNQSKVSSIGGSKLKSLQEARNLAKQSKKKSISSYENDQMFKYEQKMSELESFLTKKQESMIKQTKESKKIKLAIQKSPEQKKNIMNLLDELQNEPSYKDDFESYRQQSDWQRY